MDMLSQNARILIIGAGSGRDITACILLKEFITSLNTQLVDIAGFLTPWSLHFFNNQIEKTINKIPVEKYVKFYPAKRRALQTFFEPLLIKYNDKFGLGINNVFLFSLQYGTDRLKKDIYELVTTRRYDAIFVIDVGGDILADKNDFSTILTPIVDLACLEIVSELSYSCSIYLAVLMPGVCGEIPLHRIDEIINETKKNNSLIDIITFNKLATGFKKYVKINNEINQQTKSYSHTEKIIREITEKEISTNIRLLYKKEYQINNMAWKIYFPVQLGEKYYRSIYLFDLKSFKLHRNQIKMRYNSIIEGFMRNKLLGACGTEVDLSEVLLPFNKEPSIDNTVFLLSPCCHTTIDQREAILNYGLEYIKRRNINNILVCMKDISLFKGEISSTAYEFGNDFLFITNRLEHEKIAYDLYESYIKLK